YHWRFVKLRRRFYAADSAEDALLVGAQHELAVDGKLTVGYLVVSVSAAVALWLLGKVDPGADWHPWLQAGFAVAATPIAAYQVKRSFWLVKGRSRMVEVLMEARLR